MLNRTKLWIAAIAVVIAVAIGGGNTALAAAPRGPCGDSLTQGIPARAEDAPGGQAFAEQIRGLSDEERETQIRRELRAGNIPNFLRQLVPIRLQSPLLDGKLVDIIVCAAPDYLAIGSDDDFLMIPMRLATALATASEYGFTLPTTQLVDAIYAQAAVHFVPQPLPAGNEMRSTDYSLRHNDLIAAQRAALGVSLGALSAGDKKDLVLTNRLRDHLDRVAIYGWHTADGKPIQSLSTVHGWRYADYSHGARLISTQVFIDGKPRSIFEIMQDSRLAGALSKEGVVSDVLGLIKNLNTQAQATIAAIVPTLRPRFP
ncbi:MAG: hypothetical protein ACLQJ0_22285 [Steroidobacteraceae bacterium]|jgi:hypothetical protein